VLLPPGDAALTRRVKAVGDHWVVQEKRGRKLFSQGVWAPAATIDKIRAGLEAERSTEGYAKRTDADARRREKAQTEYVEDFNGAVVAFLAFHPAYADFAGKLAGAVADHATPVVIRFDQRATRGQLALEERDDDDPACHRVAHDGFSCSWELIKNSGLPLLESLVEVGEDNGLADPESLAKMLEAVERTGNPLA